MTPLDQAAKVTVLSEAGYSQRIIAGMMGLNALTVANIINGDHGWTERQNKPVFKQYLAEEKSRMTHAMSQLIKSSLVRAEAALDKASYLQAVTGVGILTEKVQLLSGEPTEITASYHIHEVQGLDKLCSLLGQSLMESTPVLTEENKVK